MYPHEYIQYLVHFHGDHDYFECHEILEEYWKKHDFGNKQSVWAGLIQLAVSCYHHRRGNFAGAKKMLDKARKNFLLEIKELKKLGLNETEFLSLLESRSFSIEQKYPYHSFTLPISDSLLIKQCRKLCLELGLAWETSSDVHNSFLVHRHILRDRSSVVQARNNALKKRKSGK